MLEKGPNCRTMVVSVEEVSASLVREYLSRKGLKRTIACMDDERPRTDSSINNRSELRQALNIEGLYRRNKVQISPLKTLLEVIVKYHVEGHKNDTESEPAKDFNSVPDIPAFTQSEMNDRNADRLRSDVQELCAPSSETDGAPAGVWTGESEAPKGQAPMAPLQDRESAVGSDAEKKPESVQKSRTNRIRRGMMMPGPITSTIQESSRRRPGRRAEAPPRLLFRSEERDGRCGDGFSMSGSLEKHSDGGPTEGRPGRWESRSAAERAQTENSFEKVGQGTLKTRNAKTLSRPSVTELDLSELVLDDFDYDDDLRELSKVSFRSTGAAPSPAGRPLDQHTASELKAVLLGSCLNCFSLEWRSQGFTFSETHDLRYGIVQRKGGPCGVLASVQAFVLKKMLFENIESVNAGFQALRPSNAIRRKCLVLAAAEILWRAGEEKRAMLAISSGRTNFTPTGRFKSEGVFEKITCFTVDNVQDLQVLLEQHVEQFETGLLGCLLMTVSVVLSRTIEKVREDMDVSSTTLIGAHGYCTQELVNLLLCGRAVSNVFDNDMELDSGNGNTTLLRGIKGQCDIGFLSLFEHYNICQVGTFLKTPLYPIWVVCSESHFSVLFGLQRELLTNQDKGLEFDLYYYDGLANQQEEIRLTVSLGRSALSCQDVDTDLIPPLEHCIRTRWKDAFVSWNDTEPIL